MLPSSETAHQVAKTESVRAVIERGKISNGFTINLVKSPDSLPESMVRKQLIEDGGQDTDILRSIDDEFALRGFRFFFNNLTGEEHEQEDVEDEEEDQVEEPEEETIVKPTPAFITQKLVDQGVTMEQLVKALLKEHEEYDAEEEEYLRIDDELFGKFRIIISNFEEPAEAPAPDSQPAAEEPPIHPNVTVRSRLRLLE
jgi:hypothetical protein